MILTLVRRPTTDGVTLGELFIDGAFAAFTLEPDDDGAHPAIPLGRYPVTITRSARFGRMLPLIGDVPGRSGIRIHPGNSVEDTSGCVLLGTTRSASSVGGSRVACEHVQHAIAVALAHHDDVWLTIEQSGAQALSA
jgi:hypothetical protein